MIKRITLLCISVCIVFAAQSAFARSKNVAQIPNGSKFSCTTCHPHGTYNLNPFGQAAKATFNSNKDVVWSAALAQLDSDGDGYTNGEELLDPTGSWAAGQPNPGEEANVFNPGDPASHPVASVYEKYDNTISTITPNPASYVAKFEVNVTNTGSFNMWIVALNGAMVKRFPSQTLFAGVYPFEWDLRDASGAHVADGVYTIIFDNGGKLSARQIVVAR